MNPHRPSDWWLERDDHGVTARIGARPVAHVEVRDADARVRLEFWMDERLPPELRTHLTRSVFDHPALRPCRPVSVAWPHHQTDVLQEVRRHVPDARIHVAGATCLLDGHISPAGRPGAHAGGTTDDPGASPAGGSGELLVRGHLPSGGDPRRPAPRRWRDGRRCRTGTRPVNRRWQDLGPLSGRVPARLACQF